MTGVREAADTTREALNEANETASGFKEWPAAIAALDVLVAAAERADTLEAALWEIICCADKHAHLAAPGGPRAGV